MIMLLIEIREHLYHRKPHRVLPPSHSLPLPFPLTHPERIFFYFFFFFLFFFILSYYLYSALLCTNAGMFFFLTYEFGYTQFRHTFIHSLL